MLDSILIPLSKERSGADHIFRMIVTNLLQRSEFPVSCSLFDIRIHSTFCLEIAKSQIIPINLLIGFQYLPIY